MPRKDYSNLSLEVHRHDDYHLRKPASNTRKQSHLSMKKENDVNMEKPIRKANDNKMVEPDLSSPTSVTSMDASTVRQKLHRSSNDEKPRNNSTRSSTGSRGSIRSSPVRPSARNRPSRSNAPRRRSPTRRNTSSKNNAPYTQSSAETKHSKFDELMRVLESIYAAFWERADLYTDVLGLETDRPTPRQLQLAFFKMGRLVLATPIESVDDMTTLSLGKQDGKSTSASSTISVIQSGVAVSRKAKMKFQAISLAYEILNNEARTNLYNIWRVSYPRLPPRDSTLRQSPPRTETNPQGNMTGGSPASTDSRLSSSLSGVQIHDVMAGKAIIDNDESVVTIKPRPPAAKTSLRSRKYGVGRSKPVNSTTSKKNQKSITWNEEVEEFHIVDFKLEKEPSPTKEESSSFVPNLNAFFERFDNVPPPSSSPQNEKKDAQGSPTVKENKDPNLNDSLVSILDSSLNTEVTGSSVDESISTIGSSKGLLRKESQRAINTKPLRVKKDKYSVKVPKEPQMPEVKVRISTTVTEKKKKKKSFSKPKIQLTNVEKEEEPPTNSLYKLKAPPKDTTRRFTGGYRANSETVVQETADCTIQPFPDATDMYTMHEDNDCVRPDCDLFGRSKISPNKDDNYYQRQTNDDCGVASFGMLSNFHTHLGKYITASVEEMKTGLSTLGKKWSDLDFNKMESEDNSPFFFLRDFELDALMEILDTEMGGSESKKEST